MNTKTILIADDFEGIILKLRSVLQKAGFEVIYCKDGQEAFELLSKQNIDLVITDVDMPRMNGIELTRAIRKVDRLAAIPVLVVTKELTYKESSKDAGATGWITKPYNPPKVLELVKSLL